ncbi:Crp/Fnr family transcriptional regulator [Neobacillus sp. LXY-4]|uniref:Crp/Fnr family transcriptional regulator n=1 Tax=Neobacillus sp. LXY-4 TaxID=3379826 RepID=UPI003F4A5808
MNCHCQTHTGSCVKNVPIFKGLDDDELCLVQKAVISQTYRKGEYIFQEGEPSDSLYIVHKGLVKVSKISDEGKEQIIRLLFPGDFFGQYALLENKQHYAHAEVLEGTSVCLIHKDKFRSILERNPNIAMKYMLVLSERLQAADEWIGAISLMEVERRLAKALLTFYEKEQKDEFELPVSKKDLAALIGTTPETLSRKFVYFQTLDLIDLKGRKGVKIKDVERWKEIANY